VAGEVLRAFLLLGLTSFGGPNAHLGFFQRELVERRRWVGPGTFAELVALCQLLPGPASSQVGIALGAYRAGLPGALAAWAGFTLPSAALMIAFAYGVGALADPDAGWVGGLKAAAAAVVANAAWQMARQLAPDWPRRGLLLTAAVAAALWRTPASQVAIIAAAAAAGLLLRPGATGRAPCDRSAPAPVPPRLGAACLALFAALLIGLPLARPAGGPWLAEFETFYRVGSLVFGGGHVVLPLIEADMVGGGAVSRGEFLAGYGAVQAAPGPLFSFAAYLGAVSRAGPGGVAGGLWALVAVYAPSFLLVLGTLPFWDRLRARHGVRAALAGVNAAVVGLVAAALYDPVLTEAVRVPVDLVIVVAALCALVLLRWPAWLVVVAAATAGGLRDVVDL
jgi:chromate transporter